MVDRVEVGALAAEMGEAAAVGDALRVDVGADVAVGGHDPATLATVHAVDPVHAGEQRSPGRRGRVDADREHPAVVESPASSSIVPQATSLPSTKMPMRSHTCSTWWSRCDDSSTVTPCSVAQPLDQGEQLADTLGVDVHRRLVEDEDRRVLHERVGEPEPLAHAAREVADLAVGGVDQPDVVEQRRRCARLRLGAGAG